MKLITFGAENEVPSKPLTWSYQDVNQAAEISRNYGLKIGFIGGLSIGVIGTTLLATLVAPKKTRSPHSR